VRERFAESPDLVVKKLIGDCLQILPSSRPKAALLTQRLLDEYNDSCARISAAQISIGQLIELRRQCRTLVDECRCTRKDPSRVLTTYETGLLFKYEDSWDEPTASLRLAPEINFLLGAGVFWGYINLEDVEKHRKGIADEMRSVEGSEYFFSTLIRSL
jgi:hypothetical protein